MNSPAAALQTVQQAIASFVAKPRELLINGKWCHATEGRTLEVENPADGKVFAHIAAGDERDIDLAVHAARHAFDRPASEQSAWARFTPATRAGLLLKLADLIATNADQLALLETLDNGMPLMLARFGGVMASVETLRYQAGWATKITGETVPVSQPGETLAMTLREPVGVVGQIVPWNFPLVMAVAKIAPALAVGCTVVLKPAEQTSLSALRLGELIQEAGFPPGVINIVTGLGATAGNALVAHPLVDKIAFTGSTVTGKRILQACAGNLKRVTLELGGKSPVFIFADADLERATEAATRGIFMNSGQVCAAGSRLFVHQDVYERVVTGVVERANRFKIGAGTDPAVEIGPLISAVQRNRVMSYIDAGRRDGADVMCGGQALSREGYFVAPTVLAHTHADMSVMREEIFGPVLCAVPFNDDDIDAVAALGNNSDYGLAASIWTANVTTAHKLAKRLRAGAIRINTAGGGPDPALPLGGYKQSGWGRENGRPGVEMYTELKAITIGL